MPRLRGKCSEQNNITQINKHSTVERSLRTVSSFPCISHIFRKDFQTLLAIDKGEIQSPLRTLGHI